MSGRKARRIVCGSLSLLFWSWNKNTDVLYVARKVRCLDSLSLLNSLVLELEQQTNCKMQSWERSEQDALFKYKGTELYTLVCLQRYVMKGAI